MIRKHPLMGKAIHDMTNVFWSFINFVCNMPYVLLCKTEIYQAFQRVVSRQGAFKLHWKVLEDIGEESVLKDWPEGVTQMGEYIVFDDIKRLFQGMYEMYSGGPNSETRTKLFHAIRIMQEVSHMVDLEEVVTNIRIRNHDTAPESGVSELENLLQNMAM